MGDTNTCTTRRLAASAVVSHISSCSTRLGYKLAVWSSPSPAHRCLLSLYFVPLQVLARVRGADFLHSFAISRAHTSPDCPRTMMESMDRHSDKIEDETVEAVSSHVTDRDLHGEFTPEEQKQIIQRIDRRLVVTLGVLYCVSLMDRTNLGAAVIAGMGTELRLLGDRYVSWPGLGNRAPADDSVLA